MNEYLSLDTDGNRTPIRLFILRIKIQAPKTFDVSDKNRMFVYNFKLVVFIFSGLMKNAIEKILKPKSAHFVRLHTNINSK